MGWDRSAKPKRLRRKQKRIVLLIAIVGSMVLVSAMGLWDNFVGGDAKGSIIEYVAGLFSEEEKKVVWDGMSDKGKEVILKHAPDIK